jgi:putative sigma-54 modulation protein
MEIEIQSQGFAVTPALRAHVAKRVEAALSPFKRHVRRVVARLGDENGPRGGYDKTCRIGVSVDGAPGIFAADTRPDLYAAIDCAAGRLAAALARRLNRRRDLRRLPATRLVGDDHRSPTPAGAEHDFDAQRQQHLPGLRQ